VVFLRKARIKVQEEEKEDETKVGRHGQSSGVIDEKRGLSVFGRSIQCILGDACECIKAT
jgi:hypothetical protein